MLDDGSSVSSKYIIIVRILSSLQNFQVLLHRESQVISQFASISQGTGDGRTYSEPASTFIGVLAVCNFDLVTFVPIGCSGLDFYSTLALKTTALPLGPVALLWIWARARAKNRSEAQKTAAKISLLWVEMVLPAGEFVRILITPTS